MIFVDDTLQNEGDYFCPWCHSDKEILIETTVPIIVKLHSNGFEPFDDIDECTNYSWHDQSVCFCNKDNCGWSGLFCELLTQSNIDELKIK